MPIVVSGEEFFTASDVAKDIGVVRQTLWRWRQDGKIPAGNRFRDRQILFTQAELEAIREFANRVEPIAHTSSERQRTLFDAE